MIGDLRERIGMTLMRGIAKAAGVQFLPSWVRDPFRRWTLRQLVENGYQNSAVYACIRVLAESFPEPELHVWQRTDDGDKVLLADHPLRQLLERPNPFLAEDEFWEFCLTYAAIGGNFYVWKERNEFGFPIALWPFHDGMITPKLHPTDWISHYELKVDGLSRPIPIPIEDMIHWRWSVNPQTPQIGESPIVAAARTIDMDTEAQRYVHALLHNDAMPRTVLKTKLSFDDLKLQQLKKQWQHRFGGENRGDLAILTDPEAEILRVGANLQELASEVLHNIPESRIGAVYGGPPVGYLAGLNVYLQRSTFANYSEAEEALHRRVLTAKWGSVQSAMTHQLLRQDFTEDRTLSLGFDTMRVPAMQKIRREQEAHAKEMWLAGGLSRNEFRARLGSPPLAEDMLIEQGTWIPVPVVYEQGPVAKAKAAGGNEGSRAMRETLRQRRELGQEFEDEILDALEEEQELLLAGLTGGRNGR